jgi:hypothetical protein
MPPLKSAPATTININIKDDNVPALPFVNSYSHLVKLITTSDVDREVTYCLTFNLGEARVTLSASPLHMENTSKDRRVLIGKIVMQLMQDLECAVEQLETWGFDEEDPETL